MRRIEGNDLKKYKLEVAKVTKFVSKQIFSSVCRLSEFTYFTFSLCPHGIPTIHTVKKLFSLLYFIIAVFLISNCWTSTIKYAMNIFYTIPATGFARIPYFATAPCHMYLHNCHHIKLCPPSLPSPTPFIPSSLPFCGLQIVAKYTASLLTCTVDLCLVHVERLITL